MIATKAIIHVAGINLLWRASEWSVRESVRNAMGLANQKGYSSIAFPLIGAGSGGRNTDKVANWMQAELETITFAGEVIVVRYRPAK